MAKPRLRCLRDTAVYTHASSMGAPVYMSLLGLTPLDSVDVACGLGVVVEENLLENSQWSSITVLSFTHTHRQGWAAIPMVRMGN